MVERFDPFYYIPLHDTIKSLLNDESVMDIVLESSKRIHTDGVIEDFCDGSVFKSHPLFAKDPLALQSITYYDEVELYNPLGSHVKRHKLGIVVFTLGNIPPKYRSQLEIINLAVVATVPVIEKHGLDAVLKPFVDDINCLSADGIEHTFAGTSRVFRGALLAFLADNLASNELGGFKKSFSFSFRYCRTCLCTRDSASSSFVSESFTKRCDSSHKERLKMLDTPARDQFSKTYGINKDSILLNVQYYSMFNGGLPHDIMHDLLEGVASCEVKHLLSIFIRNKLFSLDEFNRKLIAFNYGFSKSDKPVPILTRHLANSFRQSASQMLLLLCVLPFRIGHMIPVEDEHWICFLLLRKILDIVLSPVASSSICISLKLLIKDHNELYPRVYGSSAFLPKMHFLVHFLVHYPEQILQQGPMIRTWTMRHEAKLNVFKQASRLANFKNISLSLASRHQRWIGYQMASGKLINANQLECGPACSSVSSGTNELQNETKDVQDAIIEVFPEISFQTIVFRPTWIIKEGITYKCNNAFLITGSDGLDPVFSRLDEILVIGGNYAAF